MVGSESGMYIYAIRDALAFWSGPFCRKEGLWVRDLDFFGKCV